MATRNDYHQDRWLALLQQQQKSKNQSNYDVLAIDVLTADVLAADTQKCKYQANYDRVKNQSLIGCVVGVERADDQGTIKLSASELLDQGISVVPSRVKNVN